MSDTSTTAIATVILDQPIVRGETTLESVQIRKPGAGELRGLKLVSLVECDVDTVLTLLPRITIPPLIAREVETMDLADLLACANEVANFLPQRGRKTASPDA